VILLCYVANGNEDFQDSLAQDNLIASSCPIELPWAQPPLKAMHNGQKIFLHISSVCSEANSVIFRCMQLCSSKASEH